MEQKLSVENNRAELAIGVYVSSTWLDLRAERQAVEEVLHRFQTTKFVGMEYFGSRPDDTAMASLAALDRCRVYVGIFGARYGSGITELEYRRAREKGLECFVYCRPGEACDQEAARLRAELKTAHTVTEFRSPDELATKVAADLHNWIFDKWAAVHFVRSTVDGIDVLPSDYASRIENFLTEYLGTPRRPVPFGGRGAEMERLDCWLASGERPYALLAASAGRGKSALVTRWSRTLLGRPDVRVIFLPVSIRFRTNLASVVFASLAARLARSFGEEIRSAGEMTVEVWRGLVSSYLRRQLPEGRRLVVVLDGLDEAADWSAGADLFPQQPPEGLKVLATVRYRTGDIDGAAWLQALGWDHGLGEAIELEPLTRKGVSEVMLRMGAPLEELSARVDVVGELHRLSEGDPLLVRLYVEDLWSRGEAANRLQPEDLEAIRPGLDGYFQRWWREQQQLWGNTAPLREAAVQGVLNLLACALGPLTAEDLLQLAPVESGLSTWTLQEALRPLDRFVIGDGRDQGFVFSHPKLAIYFYGLLTPQERRKWDQRFLEWGAGCLRDLKSGSLDPAAAPAYLVQYYGAHLERAQAGCDALLDLMSEGWRQAWLAFEGAFNGFLNDVERAWRCVETADAARVDRGVEPQYADRAIECSLCLASVRSLAANIQPGLLAALFEKGVWSGAQVLAYLRQTPDDHQKMSGLARVAHLLPDALLEQALSLGWGCAPTELLIRMAECGRGARAVELLESGAIWAEASGKDEIGDWRDDWGYNTARESAACGIAPWLTSAQAEAVLALFGEPEQAPVGVVEALIERMDPGRRLQVQERLLRNAIRTTAEPAIVRIAARLDAETVWRVWQEAPKPSDEWDQRLALLALAAHVPAETRRRLIDDLSRQIREKESGFDRRPELLSRMLPYVDASTAKNFLRELVSPATALYLLRRAAPYLDEANIQELAEIAVSEIEGRKEIIPLIAGKLAPEMWNRVVEQLLGKTLNPRLLEFVAPYLPAEERQRAFAMIPQLEDADDQGWAIWAMAPVLDREQLENAVFQAEYVGAPAATFPRLARRLAELGEWQAAIERVDRSGNRDEVLKAVAEAVGEDEEALRAIVRRCASAGDPPGVVTAIAPKLPPKILREALQVVQRIGDIDAQDRAREAIARELVNHGDRASAVRVAERIEGRYRDEILESLAIALAECEDARMAMGLTSKIADNGAAGRVLDRCLAVSGEVGFHEALELVNQRIRQPWTGSRDTQFVLLQHWPESRAPELPRFINAIEDEWKRCHAVSLPRDEVVRKVGPQLLAILSGVVSLPVRADALAGLSVKLEGTDRASAVRELIALARSEENTGPAVKALARTGAWDIGGMSDQIVGRLTGDSSELLRIIAGAVPERFWKEAWEAARRVASPAERSMLGAQLVPRAPENERRRASQEALRDALSLPPDRQRKELLSQIAGQLAEPSRTEAWLAIFHSAAADGNEAIARVLLDIPEELLLQILPVLVRMPRNRQAILLLAHRLEGHRASLEKRLGELGRADLIAFLREFEEFDLAKVARIESAWERAYELSELAPSLSEESEQREALEIARTIDHPGARARALEALMDRGHVRGEARRELVRVVGAGGFERDEAIRLLNRARDPKDLEWRQAAAKALRDFRSPDHTSVGSVAPLAASLPAAERLRLLAEVLRQLSRTPRKNLFYLLKPMMEWIIATAGAGSLTGTADAIDRVTVWWP